MNEIFIKETIEKSVKYEILVRFLIDRLKEDYISTGDTIKMLNALGEEVKIDE